MLDGSAVAAVDIDLGVVCFVDEPCKGSIFAVAVLDFQEFLSVPHYLSCIGIMFNS
jgi:hypothetical protein